MLTMHPASPYPSHDVTEPLLTRTDRARGHDGEADQDSYDVIHAALSWVWDGLDNPDRRARAEKALTDGYWRCYGDTERFYEPGLEAVVAALTGP